MADDLMIEVKGSSEKAENALDRVKRKIDEMQAAFERATPSLTAYTKKMDELAASSKAAAAFNSFANATKKTTQIVDQFGNTIASVSMKAQSLSGNNVTRTAQNVQQAISAMQKTVSAASDPIKNLTLQIDVQGQKMSTLQAQYNAVAEKEGTSSVQALNLQSRILKVGLAVDQLTAKLSKVKGALSGVDAANSAAFSMPANEFAAKYDRTNNAGTNLTPDVSTEAAGAPAGAPSVQYDTSKIQAEMDALTAKIEGKKPKVSLDTEAATAEVRRMGAYIDSLTPKISTMSGAAQAQFNAIAAKLNLVSQQIDNQNMLYRSLTDQAARVGAEQGEGSMAYLALEKRMLSADSAANRLSATQEKLQAQLAGIASSSNKAGTSISSFGNKIKSAITAITSFGNSSERSANRSTSGWAKTMSMFEKMMIRIAAFKVYSALWQGFQTGIQDIAQASSQANAIMSALATSSLYLKNSIAAALMPAIQAITPFVTQLANSLASLFNMIGMLSARIFGNATSVTVAKAAQINYAATLDKTKASADAAKKSILGFDELSVLSKPTAGADSSTAGIPTPAQEFTTTQIPSGISSVGDSIKAELSKWAQYAQPTVIAFQNLVKSLEPLKTFAAKGLEDFYNDFLVPVGKWVLGTGLPDLLNTTSQLVQSVDWSRLNKALDDLWKALTPFAQAIGQGLINFYDDLLVPIANWTLGTGVPTFLDTMSSLLNNIDWSMLNAALDNVWKALEPFAENVGNGLLWFLQNVLSPLAQWAGNNLAPAALNLITDAIKAVNATIDALKPTGQWLFDSFLKPLAAWTGDAVVAALNAVSGALSNISTWITNNQGAVQSITTAVLAFFAAWEVTNLLSFIQMSGGLVAALIAIKDATIGVTVAKIADKAETIALKAMYAGDFLKSIVIGTEALIKQTAQWAILAASKAWDVIKTTAQVVATNLATAAQTALNFVLNANPIGLVAVAIAGLVTAIVLLYNKNEWFRNGWNAAWTSIGNGFKSFINIIISGLNGLIDGANFVISALNKIHFTVPDWVVGIGGNSVGVNIPKASKIPYLAEGALLTAPTLMVGGEGVDNEAVIPLNQHSFDSIARGISESLGGGRGVSGEAVEILRSIDESLKRGRSISIRMYADNREIARSANEGNRILDRRQHPIAST